MGGGKRNFVMTDKGGKRTDLDLLDENRRIKEENGQDYR